LDKQRLLFWWRQGCDQSGDHAIIDECFLVNEVDDSILYLDRNIIIITLYIPDGIQGGIALC